LRLTAFGPWGLGAMVRAKGRRSSSRRSSEIQSELHCGEHPYIQCKHLAVQA
jgi:hypothetical protein